MKLNSFDLHNHILPGVDDGFETAEASLHALKRMADCGCRQIVFTPHVNPDVFPKLDERKLRLRYDEFSAMIPQELGLRTHLAAEYMIVNGFERKVAEHADELLCYPDRSLLVEMSYYFKSANLNQSLFELQMANFKPILAHPERYLYLADSLESLDSLRDKDCRFQVNYISFTGVYGPKSVRIIKYLISKGWVDFVSTDLHSNLQLDNILSKDPCMGLKKQSRGLIEF